MKGRISIDRELCKGCGYCLLFCPKKVIVIEEKFNSSGFFPAGFLGNGKCTGCALCAEMCPDMAIEVWKED